MARVLVFSTSSLSGPRLDAIIRDRAGEDAEVHIVAPATHISRMQWLTDDTDQARRDAGEHADQVSDGLATDQAVSHVGDADPLQAIEDALRLFPADQIIVVTHSDEQAGWLEAGAGAAATERFSLPVTHVVVDKSEHSYENLSSDGPNAEAAPSITDAVAHPVDATKNLGTEAQRGRTARTPLLALTGTATVIAAAFLVIAVAAMLVYYLV